MAATNGPSPLGRSSKSSWPRWTAAFPLMSALGIIFTIGGILAVVFGGSCSLLGVFGFIGIGIGSLLTLVGCGIPTCFCCLICCCLRITRGLGDHCEVT